MFRAIFIGLLTAPLLALPAIGGETAIMDTQGKRTSSADRSVSAEGALPGDVDAAPQTSANAMQDKRFVKGSKGASLNAEGALPPGGNAAPQTSANPMQDKVPVGAAEEDREALPLPEGYDAAPQTETNPATRD